MGGCKEQSKYFKIAQIAEVAHSQNILVLWYASNLHPTVYNYKTFYNGIYASVIWINKVHNKVAYGICILQLYLLVMLMLAMLVSLSVSQLLLLLSYTPLGRGLDSTFHLLHTLKLVVMEQTLTADTGRLSLSSLWYCVVGPQSPHWQW